MAEKIEMVFVTTGDKAALNAMKASNREMHRMIKSSKELSNVSGNLGSKLGFVAFQFTFMAGVAGRALQDIGRRMAEFTKEGAADLSSISKAIIRSGFDITATFGDEKKAVDLLNNAIQTFGSGTTIFSTQEVADAFNAVGRATDFTGTAMERAKQQILLTKNVLNLMTIESGNAETSAINLVKTIKIFGLAFADAAHAADVLVAVNNQSSITLDGLVRSLGFAGQQARQFGISFEETATILGVIQDRLGVLNGGPGRNFSILLESLSDSQNSLNGVLNHFGIEVRDASGNLNPFMSILKQMKTALDRSGGAGTLANQVILENAATTSRGARALLSLVQGYDELEKSLDRVKSAGGLSEDFAERIAAGPEERIKRLQNAVNNLRIQFVGGLAPVLGQVTDALRSVVTDSNVQQFMVELGSIIGQNVLPFVQSLTKHLKFFAAILGKNTFILKGLTTLFIGLVAVLGGLFIIGTIGALVSVMASAFARLAGSTAFATVVNNAFFISMLRIAATMVGAFIILKAVDNLIGIFKDGVDASEIPVLALNAAMLLLGGTLLGFSTGILKVSALRTAITGLTGIGGEGFVGFGKTISNVTSGITSSLSRLVKSFTSSTSALSPTFSPETAKALGFKTSNSFVKGFKDQMSASKQAITGSLGSVFKLLQSTPGIIGVGLAAVAVIGLFVAKMASEADKSEIFKNGLVDKWDLVGIKMQFASAKIVRKIFDLFGKFFNGLGEMFSGFQEAIGNVFQARNLEEFRRALGELAAFSPQIQIGKAFRKALDIDYALKEAVKLIAQNAKDAQKSVNDVDLTSAINELIADAGPTGVTNSDINAILREVFGDRQTITVGDDITRAQLDVADALIKERQSILDRISDANVPMLGGGSFSTLGKDELKEANEELARINSELSKIVKSGGFQNIGDIVAQLKEKIPFLTKQELIDAMGGKQGPTQPGLFIRAPVAPEETSGDGIVKEQTEQIASPYAELTETIVGAKDALIEDTMSTQEATEARRLQIAENLEAEIAKKEARIQEIIEKRQQGITSKALNEEQVKLSGEVKKLNDQLEKNKTADIVLEKETVKTSNALNINTQNVDKETEALGTDIIELSRNQNSLGAATTQIDRVAIAFSLLARESSEMARRLGTVKMSKKGKFTWDGKSTPDVGANTVNELGGDLANLQEQLATNAAEMTSIDLARLAEEIKAIKVFDSADITDDDAKNGGTPGGSSDDIIPSGLTEGVSKIEALTIQLRSLLDQGYSTEFLKPLYNQLKAARAGDTKFGSDSDRIELAHGGITTGPTRALIGESGPEAVIPLDRLESTFGGSGSIGDINITIEGSADANTAELIAEMVAEVINKNIRNKPLL